MTDKAKRKPVRVGAIGVEGFQMPDGAYRMSLSSAADSVGLQPRNAFDFLRSKAAKRLMGDASTLSASEIEVDSTEQSTGQTRIRAIPLNVVAQYWLWQASRGNKKAIALVSALLEESLERRFDDAFGVARTEYERQDLLAARMRQTEQDLESLGEAYAEPDILREHVAQLEEQIRQLGGEPWQLPELDEEG